MVPYYERDGISICHGDMRDVLSRIQAADLVVTDPPYVVGLAVAAGVGQAEHRDGPSWVAAPYELVALFAQRRFTILDRTITDIYTCRWPAGRKPTGHPAEKPVPLLRHLIEISGGRLVLDPFVGSGSTLVAAKQLGCSAIGIELEERWCELAANRLEATAPGSDGTDGGRAPR